MYVPAFCELERHPICTSCHRKETRGGRGEGEGRERGGRGEGEGRERGGRGEGEDEYQRNEALGEQLNLWILWIVTLQTIRRLLPSVTSPYLLSSMDILGREGQEKGQETGTGGGERGGERSRSLKKLIGYIVSPVWRGHFNDKVLL